MKQTILLFATLFFLATENTNAQHEYVWDHYKMSVELPDDFKTLKNTDDEFECDGDGMHLYMYVFENHQYSAEDMRKETGEIAKMLKFEVKDVEHDLETPEGFDGKYILGYKDGLQVMVCGLINTKNAANFWIVIVFEDGDHTAEDEGLKIINSLKNKG
jgi:hypothetical protein